MFGQKNYRDGALGRIGDASHLLRAEQFAGAIYMGGRAVEGILRALIWKNDSEIQRGRKTLETGHDLRQLLAGVGNLGLIVAGSEADQLLVARVERVARLWYNNMRFASSKFVETRWRELREVRKGRTFKQAAVLYFNDCSAIVKRCEILCAK